MRKSLLKLLGLVAGLLLSTCVSALGMGGINVASALGQTLKAEIELVSVGKNEKTSLVARLASPDIYKGAGLEYPFGNKFTFKIEHRANGDAYIQVSSAQAINDPFVSLLVELTWSSGKLLREYTFLLDPPGYVAEQPAQAEVQAVAPVVQAAAQRSAVQPVQPVQPAPASEIEEFLGEKTPPTRSESRAKPAVVAQAPANVASGEITVKRGDTLNKIAAQNKPADVSLERMLVALYRANADQFDGKNMNRIKTGKILRLPDQDELLAVSQHDALKEIHAQVTDWNAYRQKLAGAATLSAQPQTAQQVTTGKISSSVAEKAPVAKDSAKEVLKLSKGEAPGDKTGAAGKKSAQDKANAAQEDAIAKAKAVAEEKAHAALLEKNLKDMQRLAQLKAEAAALAQKPAAASAVAAASSVAAASQVKPAPVAKPKPAPVPVSEPSLLEQVLAEPLYLGAGAAALLGLGGLGYMGYRRRQSGGAVRKPDVGSTTGKISAPVAPSPETGDFTSVAGAAKPEVAAQSDDVDPISEADLFLNFGRDVQAEEILKEALQKTPGNHQIHLKLLGIYANRNDANSFATIAKQLQDSDDDEAWQQAAAMGRKLDPGNPMYGGGSDIEDAESATMRTTVLNVDDMAADAAASKQAAAPDVDFDLGEHAEAPSQAAEVEQTERMSAEDKEAAQSVAMDFDVTSTNPSLSAPSGMDFDIAGSAAAASTVAEPEKPSPSGLDFDITGANAIPTTASAEPPLPNLDDLVFDITSTSAPAAQPEQAAPAQDMGMEFTLDFPTEKPAAAAPAADIGLSEISLNLDEPVGDKPAEVKDDHWHEVATKFDLAKAYQEMGDATGAREILEEVLREGDDEQRAAAQALIDKLG
ncbi:MAG: FimV family protein [Nitrosomonadales bacterium]|nr:FimV family protein [Nitrosomonadales bacterium]